MAKLCLPAFLALLFVPLALSADPPQIPPSPSPELATGAPPPEAGAPESRHSSISRASSPPAPAPSGSPPAPSPVSTPPSPTPSPSNSTGTRHPGVAIADEDVGDGGGGSSGGGLSSTKKAGIVAGVIVLAGLVVLAGMVYKKRKDNIRRSQYSNAARREIL